MTEKDRGEREGGADLVADDGDADDHRFSASPPAAVCCLAMDFMGFFWVFRRDRNERSLESETFRPGIPWFETGSWVPGFGLVIFFVMLFQC